MFSIGKINPESRNASRKPPSATACTAAAWLGMAAPTIEPKLITQNTNSALPAMMGVGSPANRRPKSVNISSASSEHCATPTTMPARILPSRNSCAEMLETYTCKIVFCSPSRDIASAASTVGKIDRPSTRKPGP